MDSISLPPVNVNQTNVDPGVLPKLKKQDRILPSKLVLPGFRVSQKHHFNIRVNKKQLITDEMDNPQQPSVPQPMHSLKKHRSIIVREG